MLDPSFHDPHAPGSLVVRAGETLKIMHRWGYAPRIEALSAQLLGGPTNAENLNRELEAHPDLVVQDGFVSLRGQADLISGSRKRVKTHEKLGGEALVVARTFARDLASSCPVVNCIALSGSLASGGYGPQDDIDFDLIVQAGTKYLSYLIALLVGLKYSWKYRRRRLDEVHSTPLFPKITCVNVVWPEDQSQPFVRQDEHMAFELLRCEPLSGAQAFRSVLDRNPWIGQYFPQAYNREWPIELPIPLNFLGRIIAGIHRNSRMERLAEASSRTIAWILYRYVQRSRRRNSEAVAHVEFLRRAKFPYEVFQD